MMNESRRHNLVIVASLAVMACLFCWPLFANLDYWGIHDWDAFLVRNGVSRLSVLQYGQFPLWNPFSNGGIPHLAHPEVDILSLAFLCELVFGVVIGNKVSIVLHCFLGLTGGYALGRHLRLEWPAAVLAAVVFMLSSMYALTLSEGMISGYAIGLMPWAFLFFLKAFADFRHALAAVLVLALMWLSGGIYPFCLTFLFMGTYALAGVIAREYRWQQAAWIVVVISVLTFLLAAVKFLPSIEFTSQYPRHSELYCGFSLESLWYGLTGRDQLLSAITGKSTEPGFWSGFTHGMDEVGMYVGLLPLSLFLLGLVRAGRRQLPLAVCLVVFLWLGFGYRSEPLSLWALVHKIPPYSIMRTAERFRYVFMLCLALFAGFGLQALTHMAKERWPGKSWASRLAVGMTCLIALDLVWVNSPVFEDAFPIPPLELPEAGPFIQISGWPCYDENGPQPMPDKSMPHLSNGAGYPAFLANRGTVLAYESMPVPVKALPISAPGYRGEVFLDGTGGEATYRLWSPNRLVVDVRAEGDGYVVINQNYYPGWQATGGRVVESVNGLLAVRVGRGASQVELYYRPLSWVLGAALSLVTLVGMGGWFFRLAKRR